MKQLTLEKLNDPLKTILTDFKKNLKQLYADRLTHLILYGSWARGEATPQSDIDLLVVLKQPVTPGQEIDRMIDIISETNLHYDVLIAVYPESEKNYYALNSPLLLNVRQEGITL